MSMTFSGRMIIRTGMSSIKMSMSSRSTRLNFPMKRFCLSSLTNTKQRLFVSLLKDMFIRLMIMCSSARIHLICWMHAVRFPFRSVLHSSVVSASWPVFAPNVI